MLARLGGRMRSGAYNEEGATAVLVAIVIVVLFGFTALAVDVARMYAERRELQRTADVAAMSGAQVLAAGKTAAVGVGEYYVDENQTPYHSGYDDMTDDVVAQRTLDGDVGCDIDGKRYDCVEVTVRDRSFDFLLAPVIGHDGLYFNEGNALGAKATAVVGSGAPGGEKLVPWVVTDCPDPAYDGTSRDYPVTYDQVVAKVNAKYPGRCPYEYSTAGWYGPRMKLFLDNGTASGGNFQAADMAKEPCPPPATQDGLFPKSSGSGAADYKEFLAGEASADVIPCNIGKGARLYPKTGAMVGPTKSGLDDRGVSASTCMNESSFNATVQDPDGDGIYRILNQHNPCLVALALGVHVDPSIAGVESDVPGGQRILDFQHPDAIDSNGDGVWRFMPPSGGASKPMIIRGFAMFYITDLGNSSQPYGGLFLRAVDSGNAKLDSTSCSPRDGVCVVKLAQ